MSEAEDVIQINLWDTARWRGVAYVGAEPPTPPLLLLVFENREAASAIFRGWHQLVGGAVDKQELIRLSIIEGDIAGQGPGYTVHITPSTEQLTAGGLSHTRERPFIAITRLLR